jgi:hypothetical protein
MMQLCASAARLLGSRPILSLGIEAMEYNGSLPPRIILAFISLESAINARSVFGSLSCFHQSPFMLPDAGPHRPGSRQS